MKFGSIMASIAWALVTSKCFRGGALATAATQNGGSSGPRYGNDFRNWKMAQSVKLLPNKHDDLRPDP